MKRNFFKYQGAGNDFILLDNRANDINLSTDQIARLCDRHFGIGADGLMLLAPCANADFEMVYYNADGRESTMCGNGGRCIAAFAYHIGAAPQNMHFRAIDGMHNADIREDGLVDLQMQDVSNIEITKDYALLDTGSPHFVQWADDISKIDVFTEGRRIRNLERFQPKGINVNFINRLADGIAIRTYERGVEDETLACGTGVTAAAIISVADAEGAFLIRVQAKGGILFVSFNKTANNTISNITLTGEAEFVFSGQIEI